MTPSARRSAATGCRDRGFAEYPVLELLSPNEPPS